MCEEKGVRVWIWESRSKLHAMCLRERKDFEAYLDIDLECLRETMIQSYSGGWMDAVDDLGMCRDCLDALTTLRYSDPFEPCWINTALPPWSCKKSNVEMWCRRNVHTMLEVLDFLELLTTYIPGKDLNWNKVRLWVQRTWELISIGPMAVMD